MFTVMYCCSSTSFGHLSSIGFVIMTSSFYRKCLSQCSHMSQATLPYHDGIIDFRLNVYLGVRLGNEGGKLIMPLLSG